MSLASNTQALAAVVGADIKTLSNTLATRGGLLAHTDFTSKATQRTVAGSSTWIRVGTISVNAPTFHTLRVSMPTSWTGSPPMAITTRITMTKAASGSTPATPAATDTALIERSVPVPNGVSALELPESTILVTPSAAPSLSFGIFIKSDTDLTGVAGLGWHWTVEDLGGLGSNSATLG